MAANETGIRMGGKSLVALYEPGVYIYERGVDGYYSFHKLIPGDTITITVNHITVEGDK